MLTLGIEFAGFIALLFFFIPMGLERPVFTALFHAVSAFCNAGFSLFETSLVSYSENAGFQIIIMFLIIAGGLGFMVEADLLRKIRRPDLRLSFYTKIVLISASSLIIIGTLFYAGIEWNRALAHLGSPGKRIMGALFQSVTTRTAGFNTIPQENLSFPSQIMTSFLMLIGGGSGSTAGGIKVSTAFILFLTLLKGVDESGEIRFMKRRITSHDLSRTAIFFLKAISILFICILLLSIAEHPERSNFSFVSIIFESFSAFGTVGLSHGITSDLSFIGKLVIIVTMFAGRIGLFSMILPVARSIIGHEIEYPEGEVLIG